MGHGVEIGQALADGNFIAVKSPDLDPIHAILATDEYIDGAFRPAGSKVLHSSVKGREVLVGQMAVYRVVPLTMEEAEMAIREEHLFERKFICGPEGEQPAAPREADDAPF
jgi:hypothetical protein